jgi:hypothetical protein
VCVPLRCHVAEPRSEGGVGRRRVSIGRGRGDGAELHRGLHRACGRRARRRALGRRPAGSPAPDWPDRLLERGRREHPVRRNRAGRRAALRPLALLSRPRRRHDDGHPDGPLLGEALGRRLDSRPGQPLRVDGRLLESRDAEHHAVRRLQGLAGAERERAAQPGGLLGVESRDPPGLQLRLRAGLHGVRLLVRSASGIGLHWISTTAAPGFGRAFALRFDDGTLFTAPVLPPAPMAVRAVRGGL